MGSGLYAGAQLHVIAYILSNALSSSLKAGIGKRMSADRWLNGKTVQEINVWP
jgi:hypothetical protein